MAEANIMQGTRFEDHGTRSEIQDIAAAGNVPLQANGPPSAVQPSAIVQPPAGAAALGAPSPMDQLAGMPPSGDPMTAGLSVGPGNSPPPPGTMQNVVKLSRIEKLTALATMAQSPHIRGQAQAALKMIAAQGRQLDEQVGE